MPESTLHDLKHPWTYLLWLHVALFAPLALASDEFVEGTRESLENIGAGELLVAGPEAAGYTPAVQLKASADIKVSGIVARTILRQVFRNDGRDWAEGVYVFPLPETAAVNALTITIGDRRIVGEVREKSQARSAYQAAKKSGRKAALLEQRRPNIFSTAVSNIAPGETIEVELAYVQMIPYRNERFSLRFPMTITPRYMPGEPMLGSEVLLSMAPGTGWATATDQVPDADEISPPLDPRLPIPGDPGKSIDVTVSIDAGLPLARITSAYHEVDIVRQGAEYRLELAAGSVPMDRDLEISWRPASRQSPVAAVFTEKDEQHTYVLTMMMPPDQQYTNNRLPREVVLVIDTSGSMGGMPIRAAKAAMDLALSRLQPGDSFNVIEFNDRARQLFPQSRPADPNSVALARRYVARLDAGGGTEMVEALRLALADPGMSEAEERRASLRQVVFVTDGAVGNEEALFRLIEGTLGDSRLFTVGIGAAPNAYFMRKAAGFGRGASYYVGDPAEVQQRMLELFDALEKPMLSNVRLSWPPEATTDDLPTVAPDLYMGEPLIVLARLDDSEGQLSLHGDAVDGPWEQRLDLKTGRNHPGVATLWARGRIGELSDEIALWGETESRRSNVLELALQHKLVSRYTSFLAVERQPVRPANAAHQSEQIANLRPFGQSDQHFAYPQTATMAPVRLALAAVAMLLALTVVFHGYIGRARSCHA